MEIGIINLEYQEMLLNKNNLKSFDERWIDNNEIIGCENLNAFVSINMSCQVYCDREAFLNTGEFRMSPNDIIVKQCHVSERGSYV